MKNKVFYLVFSSIILTFSFFSCEKVEENVSRITYYPIITLKGEQWNTVDVNGTYTDPGVEAKEGDKVIPVEIGGDVVNTNIPGVYTITYTAANSDGYTTTSYRYVGVIDPSVKGKDMSGSYRRNAGAMGVSVVTRISEAFYKSDNVGGIAAGGPATTVFFYHYKDDKLGVPLQLVAGSPFSCDNSTVQLGVSYKWIVRNSGYGTALRSFIKI
ncbi:MAG: DUF5011 domain-containing protein [Saprospiraceae bacterium]|nr:DUF5011 domain-containing protein [Saprospiraceae bacterium]